MNISIQFYLTVLGISTHFREQLPEDRVKLLKSIELFAQVARTTWIATEVSMLNLSSKEGEQLKAANNSIRECSARDCGVRDRRARGPRGQGGERRVPDEIWELTI